MKNKTDSSANLAAADTGNYSRAFLCIYGDNEWVVDKVKLIRERLLTAWSRQKPYADNRRRQLEFEVGVWVTPMSGVMSCGKKRKLNSRFIGPYRIVSRMSKVAYELELSVSLGGIPCLYSL